MFFDTRKKPEKNILLYHPLLQKKESHVELILYYFYVTVLCNCDCYGKLEQVWKNFNSTWSYCLHQPFCCLLLFYYKRAVPLSEHAVSVIFNNKAYTQKVLYTLSTKLRQLAFSRKIKLPSSV